MAPDKVAMTDGSAPGTDMAPDVGNGSKAVSCAMPAAPATHAGHGPTHCSQAGLALSQTSSPVRVKSNSKLRVESRAGIGAVGNGVQGGELRDASRSRYTRRSRPDPLSTGRPRALPSIFSDPRKNHI